MDISYCDDKTGFPRPSHICMFNFMHNISLTKVYSKNSFIYMVFVVI